MAFNNPGVGKGLFSQVVQSLFGYKMLYGHVKFKDMIGTHTTSLRVNKLYSNEVVLENNTAKTKTLSNEFKDLITEPVLWINPKNNQIEYRTFVIFGCSLIRYTFYIEDDDRRAFVINIKHNKQLEF